MTFPPELIATAKRLGAATLHEAAGRIGALPSQIKPVSSAFRLAGRAFTVDCAAMDNLWIHRALYRASPGDVLVVAPRPGPEAGYWGDILNEAAIARDLGGLVINGGVRDSAGLQGASFPVFARALCIRGTGKDRDALAALNGVVRVGDVVVHPGDLVVGDADGVVVVPQTRATTVVAAGLARERDETVKIAAIRSGARSIDVYGFGDGGGH